MLSSTNYSTFNKKFPMTTCQIKAHKDRIEFNHLLQSLHLQPSLHHLQLWTNPHSPSKQVASPCCSFISSPHYSHPTIMHHHIFNKTLTLQETKMHPILSQAQCSANFFLSIYICNSIRHFTYFKENSFRPWITI